MRKLIALAAVVAALIVSACGGSAPDTSACEAAMRAQYASAQADPSAPPATRPAACHGVSDANLDAIAVKILSGE